MIILNTSSQTFFNQICSILFEFEQLICFNKNVRIKSSNKKNYIKQWVAHAYKIIHHKSD